MRTPDNDTVAISSPPAAREGLGEGLSPGIPPADSPSPSPSREREGNSGGLSREWEGNPRSCILTRDRDARGSLVRLALSPDGQVFPDVRAKAPGRGAWIGVSRAELEVALAKGKLKGALSRAFKGAPFVLAPDLPEKIAAALQRNALDRLGMEAKAGNLLTGSERIDAAARSGQLHALYHVADAGADGAGKLAQAWRVGREQEGSALRGLTLPVPRATLSVALGRENVVHIGVTDRAAAGRVGEALDRWLHFIGPDILPLSCDTASQGASAPGVSPGPAGRGLNEESE